MSLWILVGFVTAELRQELYSLNKKLYEILQLDDTKYGKGVGYLELVIKLFSKSKVS